jgi:hypothetical protein
MRVQTACVLGLCLAASLCATTLEQLSMDDMIRKSSVIVRAKVTGTYSTSRGGEIWTFYRLQTIESLKSSGKSSGKPSDQPLSEVAVPGGVAAGVRQTVDGAPSLNVGQEYVLFVWIGRSGLPQLMGLSQGLLTIQPNSSGEPTASRPAAAERMLDHSGRPVDDQPVGIRLLDLRTHVQRVVGARN